jgi:hypothetical protein
MEAKKKLNQRMVTEEELTESVLSRCLFPTSNKKMEPGTKEDV